MFEDTLGGCFGFDGKYATIARKQPITKPASKKNKNKNILVRSLFQKKGQDKGTSKKYVDKRR